MQVTRLRTATIADQLAAGETSFADRPSPLAPFTGEKPPGFLETAVLSFRANSITGQLGNTIDSFSDSFAVGRQRDNNFNPYDMMTDDFLKEHPYMMPDFESGRVLDIPNRESFFYYLAKKQDDYRMRQRAGQGGFIANLTGAIAPDVGVYALGGAAGRAIGLSADIAGWLQKGNVAARAAKGAVLGLVSNVTNEGILEFVNPDRNVDEQEAFLNAATWGGAIGLGIPLAGKLLGAGREQFANTAWGRRLQKSTAQSIALARPVSALKDILKQSDDALDTALAETPNGTRIMAPIVTETSKAKMEALRQKYAASGHVLEFTPHPDQNYFNYLGDLDKLDNAATVGASIVDGKVRFADPDMLEPVIKGKLGKFGDLLSAYLPGGKMRRMPSGVARLLSATLFDDAALTVGNIVDAIDFEKPVSAEAIKPAIHLLSVQTEVAIADVFDAHFKKTGSKPITGTLSDGTQVSATRLTGYRKFLDMVGDAKRQLEENARGANHALAFDAPVLEAAKQVTAYSRSMLDRLELAGMLKGPRALATAQKALPGIEAAQKTAADALTAHKAAAPAGPAMPAKTATTSTKGYKAAYAKHLLALEANNPGHKMNPLKAGSAALKEIQAEIDNRVALANADIDAHAAKQATIEKTASEADAALKAHTAEIKQLESMVAAADHYLSRPWLKHKIEGRKDDFTGKLRDQWQKYRSIDYKTGKPLAERPMITEAFDRMDDADVKLLRAIEDETQIPTANGLAARYEQAVDAYFTASADRVYLDLTDLDNAHGVPVIIKTPDAIKARVLQIDETVFRDYLDQNVGDIIRHYDQQLAGRIAVNTTIQRMKETWAPLVKEFTGEEFDGTVEQLIRTVNRDFDDKLNAAIARGDTKAADKIRTAQKNMGLIVDRKVSELMGRPPLSTGGDAAESGWRALGRAAMRMPYMAFMGLQTVTNLMDLAGLVIVNGLNSEKIAMLSRQFGKHDGWLPTMSRKGLEAVESAIDQTRQMHLNEIYEYASDSAPPTTMFGKIAAGIDRGTAFAANKFGEVTGINWLNRTTRRVAGHLMLDVVVDGAKKMRKAGKLLDGGMEYGKALHQAGLAVEDAQRLSRLGFNAEQSGALLDQLYKHAVDVDGKRPWATMDEFLDFKGHLNPEYHAWHKTSPELFDRFTAAINSEVNNVIVSPKILSRPFMNARWVGRALNQFWGFAYAWGNQLAITVGQRPGGDQAAYIMSIVGLGALADGIHNHITGRRDFEETAKLWADPKTSMAMMYGAIDRSGVLGWLSRPLGIADREGVGIGSLLKGDGVSSRYLGNVKGRLGYFAPVGDYADRLMAGTIGNRGDAKSWHLLRGTMPYQNLLQIQGIYRATKMMGIDNPLGGQGLDFFPIPTRSNNDPADRKRPPEP